MSSISSADPFSSQAPQVPDWIALVRSKVEGLRYGVVQLIIHEGRVTQIERTEKTRLPVSPDRDGETATQP
jgi:hypothetical protein